jgi:hypothetical protein
MAGPILAMPTANGAASLAAAMASIIEGNLSTQIKRLTKKIT